LATYDALLAQRDRLTVACRRTLAELDNETILQQTPTGNRTHQAKRAIADLRELLNAALAELGTSNEEPDG
jgi:hypothetical protein